MKKTNFLFFSILFLAVAFIGCQKDGNDKTFVSINSSPIDSKKSTKDSLTLTPFGWVSKSKVITIENGFQLNIRDGFVTKVEKLTGKIVGNIGIYRRTTESTDVSQNKFRSFNSSELPNPSNPNWIVDTKWHNLAGTAISSFSTTWIVSNPPAQNDGQVIYVFSGLGDDAFTDIIQPVLQWSGGSWKISNWYVYPDGSGGTTYVNSGFTPVSVGTSLTGVITYTGQKTDGSYNYTSAFSGTTNSLSVTETATPTHPAGVPFIPQQTWAFETLEAYSSSSFGSSVPSQGIDYPADAVIKMTGIEIKTGTTHPTISWTSENNVTGFGQSAVVVSNSNPSGEVDLHFHAVVPTFTISYAGHSSLYNFNITPNLSPVSTSVIYFKDLTTGINSSSAGSPTGFSSSLIVGHTYQIYVTCYGTGTSLTSYTQTYTPLI
ncbi:MAG TPA: hypothetical protein VIM55_16420 [Mucilaginibacter sp.]